MKPRLGLLFWMITLVLSVQAYSAERQGVLRSKANGYSIGIPEGWKQVPEGLAGDILKDVFIAEGMTVHDCEAVLSLNGDDGRFEFPCLVIKVTKYSDHSPEVTPALDEIYALLKSVLGLDTDSLQEESTVYRSNIQAKTIASKEYIRQTVGHLGRYATVQLMFYCRKSDWRLFEEQRKLLFDSLLFDEGMRYEDVPRSLGYGTITHVVCAIAAAAFGLVFAFPRITSQKRASSYEVYWP